MTGGIVGEFFALKDETDADFLAMQCGDFYEFFGEDAERVAEELDLKVSQKSSHGSSYPMAGVPVDDLTPYVKALVERGYRVAVADQYETDDGHAREVTRVVTPGTLLETSEEDARYVAAVVDGEPVGVAFVDATTGRFLVSAVESRDAALSELHRFSPVETLLGPELRNDDGFCGRVREETGGALTLHDAESFAPGRARHALREQFGDAVDSVGLDADTAIAAAGAALSYVEATGVGVARSMTRLQTYDRADHLTLDATTQRNLELTATMQGDRSGSLLDVVDHTITAPGSRLLQEWVTRPRRDRTELTRRHDCVAALAREALARERVRELLDAAYDLERLASRTASGSADAVALLRVRDTLAVLPDLVDAVSGGRLADSPLADLLGRVDHEAAADLHDELAEALADEPPKTLTEGGLIRRGYDEELDAIVEEHEAAVEWLDSLAEREKREYGLRHVTVDRNKTDGYYIQVGKSAIDAVPDHYREIKTLKNSKRYTTDELDEREREVMRLEEIRGDVEYDLFVDLRERVADGAELLQDVGRAIAEVDVLASLAVHAAGNDWVRPEIHDGDALRIEAGRHPVVEQTTDFVPNDLSLDDERRFLVVTGPNMSGKSTYMRQAALIVLLAQAGSFVPADAAEIGLVDGIYTRVGALDELAQGRSTFMVEMQELSNILHSATEDSLVILDEVGRGTATYDGISIAWAATEYLHNEVRAKTLFATHYHELTGLADHLSRVANVHVAVDERDGDVNFLRTVREGGTDRSYGIHVADLAGVPEPVVSRANDVLERLRDEKAIEARGGSSGAVQTVFDVTSGEFRAASDGGDGGDDDAPEHDPDAAAVLDELRETDVNDTSPLQLMSAVQRWQERLSDE